MSNSSGGAIVSAPPSMRVIGDCWDMYSAATLPAGAPGNVRAFVRGAFFAGVAFMYDALMANADNEDAGLGMLSAVADELDEYSRDLAARCGADIDSVRSEIAALLAKR